MTTPLFNPWQMDRLKPLYETLRKLDPDEGYALMRAIYEAERRGPLRELHASMARHVCSRLQLAPRLAAEHDLDELARQFADYVLELNFETTFLILNLGDPDRLFGRLVDMGNADVLDAATARGPVLLTPLHVGPCYTSLGVLAHRFPLTTLYHNIQLDDLRDTWFPSVDLAGIGVPADNVMSRCLETLGKGRLLSIFPELDPQGIGPLHVPVPFLGTHVAAPTGPAMIAQRTGALIVPYTFSRTGPARYAFHFAEPIAPGEGPGGRRAFAERLFAYVEDTLLDGKPGQWEMWWEFERMADHAWVEAQQAPAS
jgi:lauroyl/myristoyl acyltransferase